jgi:cyclophilin family peptidyl-prolyl cis-trans isomerase
MLRGLLLLFWRQGVQRPSRTVFWTQLIDILVTKRLILEEYIWLLMLNEHFLDYKETVYGQVTAQLDIAQRRARSDVGRPSVAAR